MRYLNRFAEVSILFRKINVAIDRAAPPSPNQSSISQTASWIFRPLEFMKRTRDELGDVFTVDVFGWSKLVLVSDPHLVKEVFAADPAILQTGKANDLMGPVVGKSSVFLLDGTEHRQVRRVLVNAFNLEAARKAAAFAAQRTSDLAREKSDGRFHDVHLIFSEIALGTMLNAVFGQIDRARVREYARQFHLILGGLSTYLAFMRFLQKDFGPGSPGWWIKKKMATVHQMIECDLAALNLDNSLAPAAQILRSLQGLGYEDAKVVARDQIVSLIVAGHDTVASALSWSLYWLLRKPHLIEALREEASSSTEASTLLDAVCLEALRLVPTVEIVSREAMTDFPLGDYIVPAGTLISPCVYLAHRNKFLYPNPEEFLPERFINRQLAAHEYFPFGGGLRRCLGANMGLLEMKAVLVATLSEFDIEPAPLERVTARRRNVTIAPGPNFRIRFNNRSARGAAPLQA